MRHGIECVKTKRWKKRSHAHRTEVGQHGYSRMSTEVEVGWIMQDL